MIAAQLIQNKGKGKKSLAVLIDPDKWFGVKLIEIIDRAILAGVDYLFVGGSLLTAGRLEETVGVIKENCAIPVVLFPGSYMQVTPLADAILFLSLISGRNPELLIGNHVLAAPSIRASGIEVIPTGYMLIDGGAATSVSYMSHTIPIPSDKPEIAACTAMAGEMLGLRAFYLDAGSGALRTVGAEMVKAVRMKVSGPLIVGGGIRRVSDAKLILDSGADIIVTGNAIETDPGLVNAFAGMIKSYSGAAGSYIKSGQI